MEDIIKIVERIVLETCQKLMLESLDDRLLIELMRNWEIFYDFLQTESENRTMYEETQLFVEKLNKLNDLIGYFYKEENMKHYVDYDVVNRLEKRLNQILANVKNDKSLNAGGKFEWVDSLLVKVSLHFF